MAEEIRSEGGRRPDWPAMAVAPLLLVAAALIVWDMGRLTTAGGYDRIGPTTVPYLVAGGLVLLAAGNAIAAWRGRTAERERQELRPVVWIVGALVLQIVLLPFVGFIIATGLMFALAARGFEERRFWITVPAGLVLAGLVWVIFARLLRLTLPEGAVEQALVPWVDLGAAQLGALWQGLAGLLPGAA